MPEDDSTPDWGPKAVLERLEASRGADSTVSTQLFLHEQVKDEDLARFVDNAAAAAAAELGLPAGAVRVGKAFPLARSVGLIAPLAVIARLMARTEFVDLLPSDLDDVMMKPVRKKP